MARPMDAPFPGNPAEITTAWLGRALCQPETVEPEIDSFICEPFASVKGALGQVVRLTLNHDCDPETVPTSLIAKFAPAEPRMRTILHQARFFEREVRFYEELAGDSTLRTPECYFSALNNETGHFLLLLEDLSGARCGDRMAGCSPQDAELALRAIAGFHAAWWEKPRLVEKEWLQSYQSASSLPVVTVLYQQFWEPFVTAVGDGLPPAILETGRWLGGNLDQVFVRFHRPPRTLVHNDYMLDNLFFDLPAETSDLAVIDWQFVTHGCGMLDVSSLLASNLSIEDRRAHEMDLLSVYHGVLLDKGVRGYSFARALDDYRFTMLEGLIRMVLAVGGGEQGQEERTRAHRDIIWPRYCAALQDLYVVELLTR